MKINEMDNTVEYKSHEDMSGNIKENFPPIIISVFLPLSIILILLWMFAIAT